LPCLCPAFAGRQAAGRRQAGGRQGVFFMTKQSIRIQRNKDCFIRRLADEAMTIRCFGIETDSHIFF